MPYAIFRFAKLKNCGQIAGSAGHAQRTKDTPNADANRANIWLIGNPNQDLVATVRERIGKQTIRTNAVLCVDLLLGASPEYFRPGREGEAGVYEQKPLEAWVKQNQRWLSDRFGSNLISAVLHLDEATPHIQAHFVPIDEKGKLNCSAFFGSPQMLREWQDNYAEAMEPLGLERGIRGSKATHIDIQQYYGNINSLQERDWQVLEDKARDRDRAERQRKEMEATARMKEAEADRLREQNQQLQLQIINLQNQQLQLQNLLKKKSKQFEDISLKEVAYELALEPVASGSGSDNGVWYSNGLQISLNGSKFSDTQTGSSGNGAVDLVKYALGYSEKDSIAFLADRFGSERAIAASNVHFQQQAQKIIDTLAVPIFTPPVANESKWSFCRDYLVYAYGLSPEIVDRGHEVGRIYSSQMGQVVFLRQAVEYDGENIIRGETDGAYLLSIEAGKSGGLAVGSKRDSVGYNYVWGDGDEIDKLVLCDSTIEALSLGAFSFNPPSRCLFVSQDGTENIPFSLMRQFFEAGKEIVVATGVDPKGLLASAVQKEFPSAIRIEPAHSKTWNEELIKTREQIQNSQKQNSRNKGGFER